MKIRKNMKTQSVEYNIKKTKKSPVQKYQVTFEDTRSLHSATSER